jgi:hypothetical protein
MTQFKSAPSFINSDTIPSGYFDGAVARILDVQSEDGCIAWFKNGAFDPWNHLESAMGLSICGATDGADKAYKFLFNTQLDDGSWWGQLGSDVPIDEELQNFSRQSLDTVRKTRDTNFIAYIATACWHYHLIRQDTAFLKEAFSVVEKAINFVLSLQTPEGDIRWTAPDSKTPEDDALLTGCSSIYKSLGNAINLAEAAAKDCDAWRVAHLKLGDALRYKPERFDRSWGSKERYSMDWYYPVLSGALAQDVAKQRLLDRWDKFVVDGMGCKCVSDEPWVTTAESAELVLALKVNGQHDLAREHLSWLHKMRNESGAYWMGYQLQSEVFWPVECPPWTAGAVLLASDAVCELTPAHALFNASSV